MARLRVQEEAQRRGLNMSQLQYRISARARKQVPLGTLRRYWYSTRDGKATGLPIAMIDMELLTVIAQELGVAVADLVNEREFINSAPQGANPESVHA